MSFTAAHICFVPALRGGLAIWPSARSMSTRRTSRHSRKPSASQVPPVCRRPPMRSRRLRDPSNPIRWLRDAKIPMLGSHTRLSDAFGKSCAASRSKISGSISRMAMAIAPTTKMIRTPDIFLTELAAKSRGKLPPHFCITLPKVALPDEVAALADICSRLEPMLDLEPGALRIEIMVETPQSIFNERGEATLLPLVSAARGRCVAAHFGPYDYTSSLGIAAPRQAGTHPASDFARQVMQVALAETGVRIADGPLNILPIPPYRAAKDGGGLTARQIDENRATVQLGWKLQFEHVRRALELGFYQGWDLHPAQLPARFAAVYSFFLENLDSSAARLKNFVEKAAQATRIGQVFDDAAMVQGLLNYFLQAIHCGALTREEVETLTGLTQEEIQVGSFVKILARRSR